ncbi:MAG: rRNA maturation RNase YbeY [Acidimicrobiia bacterium]|nr:rRNA maturation RNase YbeY [Acidimicrobiia bacterium]
MSVATPIQVFGADEQDVVAVDVLRYLRLAQLVLDEERVPPEAEMSVVFVGEDTIADLNERFLEGDGPTDVLAFPIDDDALPGGRQPDQGGRGPGSPADESAPPIVLGDVLVCPAVAQRQAEALGRDLDDELALLVVHGVLHLLAYDHAEPEATVAMQQRETELLGKFREGETAGEGTAGEGTEGAADDRQ